MEGCSFQARVDFQINREVLEKVMEHKHAKHPYLSYQLEPILPKNSLFQSLGLINNGSTHGPFGKRDNVYFIIIRPKSNG